MTLSYKDFITELKLFYLYNRFAYQVFLYKSELEDMYNATSDLSKKHEEIDSVLSNLSLEDEILNELVSHSGDNLKSVIIDLLNQNRSTQQKIWGTDLSEAKNKEQLAESLVNAFFTFDNPTIDKYLERCLSYVKNYS